jgi:hypothetical protein
MGDEVKDIQLRQWALNYVAENLKPTCAANAAWSASIIEDFLRGHLTEEGCDHKHVLSQYGEGHVHQ